MSIFNIFARKDILDEAHTYGGAKGMEVGTLLKRVMGIFMGI